MNDIYILAIETSCDETSIAIVKNGSKCIYMNVLSQMDLHANFGGVVPEIASRKHTENITMVLEDVLNNLERWYDVDVFVASPSLRELRFTASFSGYEHLDKILKTLSLTTHIAFKLKGRLLIVQEE